MSDTQLHLARTALHTIGVLARSTVGTAVDVDEVLHRIQELATLVLDAPDCAQQFGATSQEMEEALELYENEESSQLASREQLRSWIESIAMAEADQSRYQDVCDVLAQHGLVVSHRLGQDAHEVIENLLSRREEK